LCASRTLRREQALLSATPPVTSQSRRVREINDCLFERCNSIRLCPKSGRAVEHSVEQRAKARALAEAGENRVRLLLESSVTDFVCGAS
jgi:hypothetical protein